MKQHVAGEQLLELTNEAALQLRSWYQSRMGEDRHNEEYEPRNTYLFSGGRIFFGLPYLSIGLMIEFLDEHTNGNDLVIRIHSAGSGWQRPGERLVDIDGLRVSEIEDKTELCDALWDAVRQVLETKGKSK